MAEFLIYWQAHYMDSWNAAKVASLSPEMKAKYDRRYQMGDIVEVREDGYWATRGFDKNAFCVVKAPGLALDPDKMASLILNEMGPHPVTLRRRKWFANRTKIPTAVLNKVESKDRMVTVTAAQVAAFIEAKT